MEPFWEALLLAEDNPVTKCSELAKDEYKSAKHSVLADKCKQRIWSLILTLKILFVVVYRITVECVA